MMEIKENMVMQGILRGQEEPYRAQLAMENQKGE